MDDIQLQQYRDYARRTGKKTFKMNDPCDKCGSYECYTNRKKGRGCVGCKKAADLRAREKRNADFEALERLREQRRESYYRHRPSHNPEQILFNGVRRAGILEAGTRTQEEFQALENKALLLKHANGDIQPGVGQRFTLDHALVPAAGAIWKGRKIIGRTVAPNLHLLDVKKNKAKSNQFREVEELPESVYTEITPNSHFVEPTTTTEEFRALYWKNYGVKTWQDREYEPKRPDPLTDTAPKKREALTEIEALRRGLVLEISMAGYRYLLEPSEPYPLPKVWNEKEERMITPVIRVQEGLYPFESIWKAVEALRWLDMARHQVDQAWRVYERITDTEKAPIKTKPIYGETFLEDGLKDRIEQHFIEWVVNWWRPESKPIFDFVGLVEEQQRNVWFDTYIEELHTAAGVGRDKMTGNRLTFQTSPYVVPKPEPEASFWEGWQ